MSEEESKFVKNYRGLFANPTLPLGWISQQQKTIECERSHTEVINRIMNGFKIRSFVPIMLQIEMKDDAFYIIKNVFSPTS